MLTGEVPAAAEVAAAKAAHVPAAEAGEMTAAELAAAEAAHVAEVSAGEMTAAELAAAEAAHVAEVSAGEMTAAELAAAKAAQVAKFRRGNEPRRRGKRSHGGSRGRSRWWKRPPPTKTGPPNP